VKEVKNMGKHCHPHPPYPPIPPIGRDFATFVAVMPSDNPSPIAPGGSVAFPIDGPSSNGGITRLSSSSFNLECPGSYLVLFQVPVTEAGQLVIALNGVEAAYTVVGRAQGNTQIVEMTIVNTFTKNTVLTVRNPAGNVGSLTVTPNAGGAQPVSAQLNIIRLR
jgi:hypothetical protein